MGGGQTVMFTSDPKIIRNEKEKVTDLDLNSRLYINTGLFRNYLKFHKTTIVPSKITNLFVCCFDSCYIFCINSVILYLISMT